MSIRVGSIALCAQRTKACSESCTFRMTYAFGLEDHCMDAMWHPGARVVVLCREKIVVSVQKANHDELTADFGST